MNFSSLIFLLQSLQVPTAMITHTEFTQDKNLQGKASRQAPNQSLFSSSSHIIWSQLVPFFFFFFYLGPCGHSEDIPFICPGQTSPSLSKIDIDSHLQPTSLEKTGTNTLWQWFCFTATENCRTLCGHWRKVTEATVTLNILPSSLHWPY